MALFYSEKSAKKPPKPTACQRFSIQALDYQGLGVAKLNSKTWFVENALPNEVVEGNIIDEKPRYGRVQAVKIVQKSAQRQTPFCTVYGLCGGCQMQHIPLEMQRQAKQDALFQRLQKLQATPIAFQPMIVGEPQSYRRRAKLSIAMQKNRPIIGFRQANSQAIVPISRCDVLVPALNQLLPELQALTAEWKTPQKLGHIELVAADNGVVMLLRHIGEIGSENRQKLLNFAENANLNLFVMGDKTNIERWRGADPYYDIDDLKLHFSVRDFIQVNAPLNRQMVATALDWLALNEQDRVLDLFCGMGNFTLPIAKRVKSVVGIEGVGEMVSQARQNAANNRITNADFFQTDLDQAFVDQAWASLPFDKVLLDPARNGALFCLDHLCALAPKRIVYVSCNPATLVRDAEKLIANGYRIQKAAMIDMFPHTGHLESVTLFVK